MKTSTGCGPEDLCLRGVQLQSVRAHPDSNVVHTAGDVAVEL